MVTGTASGIGRAIAIECSKTGAKVVITDKNEEQLTETFNQLEGDGHLKISGDLTCQTDLDKLVDLAPALTGLVNCAGLADYFPCQFINKDRLNKTFDVNFHAPLYLLKSC